MFSKNNILAALLILLATRAAAFAQQTPQIVQSPELPRLERQMQIFTDNGGGYLGVQSQEITKENFSKFGLRDVRGVAIEKVLENSPAAQAGLQAGDVVISLNGEEVTSARKLTRLVSEVAPDHQAEITVLRGGSERKFNVTIGKRPVSEFQESALGQLYGLPSIPEYRNAPEVQIVPQGRLTIIPTINNARQIGVGVAPLGAQLGDYFGVAGGKGLLINNVRENSPAAKAGLKAGDVIVEADGRAVNNTIDLTRAVKEKKEGDISLAIIRNKNRQTVRVTPEKRSGAPQEFFMQSDENPDLQQRQFLMLMQQLEEDSAPKFQRQPVPRVQ